MALTQQEKENYHQLIQEIYDGAVQSSPSQITEEVTDVVNTILNEVVNCSKA